MFVTLQRIQCKGQSSAQLVVSRKILNEEKLKCFMYQIPVKPSLINLPRIPHFRRQAADAFPPAVTMQFCAGTDGQLLQNRDAAKKKNK